jgi:hypothetical protein
MRSAGLLLVLVGCGFRGHGSAEEQPPPPDAGAPDSPSVPPDAGVVPDAMRSEFCSVTGVVACYEFEDNTKDGSPNGLDASPSGVSYADGKIGRAMKVDTNSKVTAGPSNLVNVDQVTIEAWLQPTQLPSSQQQQSQPLLAPQPPPPQSDILDIDNQYAFFLNPDGTLTCDLHGVAKFSTAAPTGAVPVNQWTHVACTYDGAASRIYLNGNVVTTKTGGGTLMKVQNGDPMGIAQNFPSGSQLIGLIDELRLVNIARSPAEICTDAGKSSCP